MTAGAGGEHIIATLARAPDVFISYASHDSAVADDVTAALEGEGLKCWIAPRDVTPGAHYASEIVHALDSAKAVVLILSQAAGTSPHVLREIERATSKRDPVVTLRLDQAPLPAEFQYFLNTSQWLDVSDGHVTLTMPKLVAAVKNAIKAPTAAAATLTSHPIKHSGSVRTPYRAPIFVTCLAGLVLGGFVSERLWFSSRHPAATPSSTGFGAAPAPAPVASAIPDKSIAVLPFADMSEKKDQEYFADGMAEEILTSLSKIDDLKVAGRTSSFTFKGKLADSKAIGAALGVAHLLEGSVRKQGGRVRISVQLVRAETGFQRWSSTYDGKLADIFDLQDRIARDIAGRLQVLLGPGDNRLVAKATNNTTAYGLFIEAQVLINRRLDLIRALGLLNEAVRLDPLFTRAWAKLAVANAIAPQYASLPWETGWNDGAAAAHRALELDPANAESYAALGYIYLSQRKFTAMAGAFERALRLDSGDTVTLYWTANALASMGRMGKAQQLIDDVLRNDPVNALALQYRGLTLYAAGDLHRSQAASAAAVPSGLKIAHIIPSQIEVAAGDYDVAKADFIIGFGSIKSSFNESQLATVFQGTIGDPQARAKALAEVARHPDDGYAATFYLLLAEPERAFAEFEHSRFGLSDVFYIFLWLPSEYSRLARQSRAFQGFAKRLGMVDYWKAQGWPDQCRPAPTRGADAFDCH